MKNGRFHPRGPASGDRAPASDKKTFFSTRKRVISKPDSVRIGKNQKKGKSLMAVIAQKNLFSWENVDAESDLRRLELVLEIMIKQ